MKANYRACLESKWRQTEYGTEQEESIEKKWEKIKNMMQTAAILTFGCKKKRIEKKGCQLTPDCSSLREVNSRWQGKTTSRRENTTILYADKKGVQSRDTRTKIRDPRFEFVSVNQPYTLYDPTAFVLVLFGRPISKV